MLGESHVDEQASYELSERISDFVLSEAERLDLDVASMVAAAGYAHIQLFMYALAGQHDPDWRRARAFDMLTVYSDQVRLEVEGLNDEDPATLD